MADSAEALVVSERDGLARFVAAQPHYNLMERDYEQDLAPLLAREGISALPYYALAKGFLTGKYTADTQIDSVRAEGANAYLTDRGRRVLAELANQARRHQVSSAAVALAWLGAQPTVSTPTASARTRQQLAGLLAMAELTLSAGDIDRLSAASGS